MENWQLGVEKMLKRNGSEQNMIKKQIQKTFKPLLAPRNSKLADVKPSSMLNYYWRVVATGLSFATFGAGGVVIALVISPTVQLLTRDPEARHVLAQKTIKYSFRSFVEMMRTLGIMTYDIQDVEKLENSYGELIVANHPTLIDVVMLIAFLPQANCVVKQSLWTNPFTRGAVRSAGYILNRGSEQFIEDCVEKLSADQAGSLVIFPEGTRTEKGELLNKFQRGASNIAVRASVPLRPVVIRCTPSTLTKNEKWYRIPKQPFHMELKVLDSVQISDIMPATDLQKTDSHSKAVRQLNSWLFTFFENKLLGQ